MGRLLDMELVAEGVEQLDQLKILQQFGCHYYQGYLSSPAVSIEEFERILAEDAKSREQNPPIV
jgi:EAL domain-containing protein (putative c-di-GMP-specific phosphodiesterase class I)